MPEFESAIKEDRTRVMPVGANPRTLRFLEDASSHGVMDQIDPRNQELLGRYFSSDATITDIAIASGLTPTAVSGRLARTLRQIKRRLPLEVASRYEDGDLTLKTRVASERDVERLRAPFDIDVRFEEKRPEELEHVMIAKRMQTKRLLGIGAGRNRRLPKGTLEPTRSRGKDAPILNPYQIKLLSLVAKGMTFSQIGREVDRSRKTIETHFVTSGPILAALNCQSVLAAVARALDLGLIKLDQVAEGLEIGKMFTLSAREKEVADQLVSPRNFGVGRKVIAESLGISVKTIEGYVTHIYRKLGIKSREQLLVINRKFTRDYADKYFTDENLPPVLDLAIEYFGSLDLPREDKVALLTYFLWQKNNGKYKEVRKYMGLNNRRETDEYLDRVMESEELAARYEFVEPILVLASDILYRFSGEKSLARLKVISETVKQLFFQGLTEEDILQMAKQIAKQANETSLFPDEPEDNDSKEVVVFPGIPDSWRGAVARLDLVARTEDVRARTRERMAGLGIPPNTEAQAPHS